MSQKFNKGNKVRCINAGAGRALTHGFTYRVDQATLDGMVLLEGSNIYHSEDRFILDPMFVQPTALTAPTAPDCDPVVHPSHYTRFLIEPMTFAAANKLNGLELNVVKYTLRAPYKGKTEEDYRKAIRCIEMLIETSKREARIKAGEKAGDVWSEVL